MAAIPGPLSRNILNNPGNLSLQKMKPLCLPHICRGSPDRFGQAVRRKYEAVTSSRGSPDQFSEISGIFRKSGPGKRSQVRRASFTVSFYRVKVSIIPIIVFQDLPYIFLQYHLKILLKTLPSLDQKQLPITIPNRECNCSFISNLLKIYNSNLLFKIHICLIII